MLIADIKAFSRKKIFLAFLIVMSVGSSVPALNSAVRLPFNLDEVEESGMGWKFQEIGPRTFHDVPDGGQTISHPLLYTFTHALVQRFFGPGEIPLRLYGVFHFILSLLLVVMIARRLIGDGTFAKRAGIATAAMLFVVNPLIVQHSVIINADNNINTTLILLFLYFFVKYEKDVDTGRIGLIRSRILLGILFALCLWSKLFAPLFMLAGLIFARLLKGEHRKTVGDILGVAYVGILLFWATWWLYCYLTETDVMGFIRFTVIGKSNAAFSARNMSAVVRNFIPSFRWPVYWVSAPFFIFVVSLLGARVLSFLRKRKIDTVDAVFIAAIFMWLPFQFIKPSIDMMKYQYPSYPLFFIVIGYFIARLVEEAGEDRVLFFKKINFLIVPVWALIYYHYYRIGDYILALWGPMWRHLNGHFYVYYYLPIIMVTLLFFLLSDKRSRIANTACSLIFLMVPINAGLLFNQAGADYITAEVYQNYGEKGFRDAVKYIAKNIGPDDVIIARHDVIAMLRRRDAVFKGSTHSHRIFEAETDQDMVRMISDPDIKYLVLDQVVSPFRLGERRLGIIGHFFGLDKEIGSFFVLKRR